MLIEFTKFETVEIYNSFYIKNPFLQGKCEKGFFSEMIGFLGEYIITIQSNGISMRRISSGFPETYLIDFCRSHKDILEISPEQFLGELIDRQNKIQDLIEVSKKILSEKKNIKEKKNGKSKG